MMRRSSGRIAFDYFNRADGALGTADSGQAWVAPAETLAIASNVAARGTSTPAYGATAFLLAGTQSQTVEADIKLGSGDSAGLRVLAPSTTPEQNGWGIYFTETTARINLFYAGGSGNYATKSYTWAANATKRVKVIATQSGTTVTISGYVDGALVISVTGNYGAAGTLTYAGMMILRASGTPTSTIDNFVIRG